MLALHAGFWVVSLVLVGSGAAKIAEPEPFARFVSDSTGWGIPIGLSRTAAVVELLLGLAGLIFAGRLVAGLIAVVYLLFALVVAVALRNGASTCGCFGAASSKPKPAHLAMNVVSCVVAAGAAGWGASPVADGLRGIGSSGRIGANAFAVIVAVLVASAAVMFVDTR